MMGMNWGYALAQGGAAAAGAGADLADKQLKEEAEMRAADRKLADQERLLAIQEAMKNRAAERFSAVAKQKAGEEVPMEGKAVTETGLTQEGATAAGLQSGIQGDVKTVKGIVERAKMMLTDPNSTDEQKQQAQELIAQIEGQVKTQEGANAKAAEGKTRKRTWSEAIQAAREDTALNDAPAFIAGESMFGADRKADLEERKIQSREKIEDEKNKQREKEAVYRDEQAQRRHEALMERLEKQGQKGVETQNKQLLVQGAIALRDEVRAIDKDIGNLQKLKKDFKYDEGKLKEIDADIDEKKNARKEAVELVHLYFKGSGVNLPTTPEKETSGEPKPGGAGAASNNDPFGLRKPK
jgi:hypothetical protein